MATSKSKIVKAKNILLLFVVITSFIVSFTCKAIASSQLPIDDSLRLNDMVITLMMPQIQSAVNEFYSPYLTINPTVATYYGTEIVEIQGGEQIHEGIYNSHYKVLIEVTPYVGPHIAVGTDRITFDFNPLGITLEDYNHLKNNNIPSHLQSLLKKPLP